jgi:hypothetical protein
MSIRMIVLAATLVSGLASSATSMTPCADSTRKAFNGWPGEYDVVAIFRQGASSWDSTSGRATMAWEFDGCLLREAFTGTRYGEPYSYLAYWGAAGWPGAPVQRSFVHSLHGLLSVSDGNWNATRDTVILLDTAFVRGIWIRQRVVMTRGLRGELRREGQRSEDGGKSWFVTERFLFIRRR